MLDKFIDTSRYVYNKTVEHIRNGHPANFQCLRDLLVTTNTQKHLEEYKAFDGKVEELRKEKKTLKDKDEIKKLAVRITEIHSQRREFMKGFEHSRNSSVKPFEVETPKDIRACAVKKCCDAVKSGISNLKNGNIRHFNLHFKKKKDFRQSIELTPKLISIEDKRFKIAPKLFKDNCYLKIHNKSANKIANLKIQNNVDILRQNGEYFVYLLVEVKKPPKTTLRVVAGIDLGIRTFATVHSSHIENNDTSILEYKHNSQLLKKLNEKIKILKILRRVRKKQFNKVEKRKSAYVDRLQWDFINDLLNRNDVIYLGGIESHDIVKGGKNKSNNTAFNDLKFYQLKKRLIYKAYTKGKKVFIVPEQYTTKTCSSCGALNHKVGAKEVFECSHCNLVTGRDINASKNIKMKGIMSHS
jgi:IS605 OrfB family transposase